MKKKKSLSGNCNRMATIIISIKILIQMSSITLQLLSLLCITIAYSQINEEKCFVLALDIFNYITVQRTFHLSTNQPNLISCIADNLSLLGFPTSHSLSRFFNLSGAVLVVPGTRKNKSVLIPSFSR